MSYAVRQSSNPVYQLFIISTLAEASDGC